MEGNGVHTLIQVHQKIASEKNSFEMGFYPCLEFLEILLQIGNFLKEEIMSVVEIGLLIDIDMCFSYLMTNKYQMKTGSVDRYLKIYILNSLTASKKWYRKYKESKDSKCMKKL